MAFINIFPRYAFSLSARATRLSSRYGTLTVHRFRKVPVLRFTGIATVGLGLSALVRGKTYCDPRESERTQAALPSSPAPAESSEKDLPPPPVSSVSIYELTFGTVTGICAGIFIKKGVKAVAFLLGATFVMLQYLGSVSMLRIDWGRMERRFEEIFYTVDSTGKKRAPTIGVAWRALMNFLMADFPPRASFMAGLVLGLRIG